MATKVGPQRVGFSYGCLFDPLEKQAKEQGFTLGHQAKTFEKCRKALHTLRFGIDLPEGEFDKLCRRLHNQVIKSLKPAQA